MARNARLQAAGETPGRRGDEGFSLPELLAALAVLGIVAGIGFYTVNTGGWRTGAVSGRLAQRLQLAATRAVFQQNDFVVRFDLATNTYSIHDDRNSDGTVNTAIGETVTTYELDEGGTRVVFGIPAGVEGIDGATPSAAVTFAGSPPRITFTPRGTATTGEIYLVPAEDLERGIPDRMRAITVTAATARIRRWRYDAGASSPGPWRLEQ